jgi:hypothetical protein
VGGAWREGSGRGLGSWGWCGRRLGCGAAAEFAFDEFEPGAEGGEFAGEGGEFGEGGDGEREEEREEEESATDEESGPVHPCFSSSGVFR